MNRFSNQSSFPPLWQAALATLMGVGIGLGAMQGLSHYKKSKQPHETGRHIAAVAKPVQKSPMDLANMWPHLDTRMNVLLMGVDSNGHDTERFKGCRSDTIIIASLDPETKKVALVSIPRDSRVRIADKHGVEKINAAHALGGPELTVKTVSEDFGVPIDHYMVIDTHGLKKLFETLGPVEVLVEKPMHYRDRAGRLNIALEPGVNKLDATQLEEYVRFRHDAKGDIGRIERQQWFLRAMKKKLEEPQVLLKIPELCKLANQYVVTDLEVGDMLKLAGFAKDLKSNQIQTSMLPGDPVTINGGSYWVPNPETAALILHRMTGAPLSVSVIATNTGASIHSWRNSDDIEGSGITEVSYSNDMVNTALADATAAPKPTSVIVRYPKGHEDIAKNLEARLTEAGYTVRWRERRDLAECQHEVMIQSSIRADDDLTAKLKGAVAELENYPVSVTPENRASADFVIVVSPTTNIIAPIPVAKELDKTPSTTESKATIAPTIKDDGA